MGFSIVSVFSASKCFRFLVYLEVCRQVELHLFRHPLMCVENLTKHQRSTINKLATDTAGCKHPSSKDLLKYTPSILSLLRYLTIEENIYSQIFVIKIEHSSAECALSTFYLHCSYSLYKTGNSFRLG